MSQHKTLWIFILLGVCLCGIEVGSRATPTDSSEEDHVHHWPNNAAVSESFHDFLNNGISDEELQQEREAKAEELQQEEDAMAEGSVKGTSDTTVPEPILWFINYWIHPYAFQHHDLKGPHKKKPVLKKMKTKTEPKIEKWKNNKPPWMRYNAQVRKQQIQNNQPGPHPRHPPIFRTHPKATLGRSHPMKNPRKTGQIPNPPPKKTQTK